MINPMCIEVLSFCNSLVQTVVMLLGVIVTGYLTFLLWKTTKKLGKQQTEIQKEIAKNNIEFQEKQDKNSCKLALYQNRLDCYLSVVEVYSSDLYDVGIIFGGDIQERFTDLDLVKKSHANKNLLFRSYTESLILFDKDVSDEFKKIYDIYYKMHTNFGVIKSLYKDDFVNKIETEILKYVNVNSPVHEKMGAISRFFADDNNLVSLFIEFPSFKDFLDAHKEFIAFHNDSKLYNLVFPYLDIKDLS